MIESVLPRVAVFGLGGTIAMTSDTARAVVPALTAAEIVAAVPALDREPVDLAVTDLCRRPGASVTLDDVLTAAGRIRDSLAAGCVGAVVTQGTDTIEETAYLLDLLHRRPEPIVVTGAMRNPALAGADGPANLLAAVQIAASTQARDLGCLVAFADEIHAAGRVRKGHTSSPGTFVSADGGPLGYVVEGVPRVLNRPTGTRYTVDPIGEQRPRVAVVPASLGDDGLLLPAPGQVDGLVIAGFGAGHVPESWLPALTDLVARIPVVLASRTAGGPVLADTYGFPGSERDLIDRGLIPAGFLDPYKARLLLFAALATGTDVAAAFAAATRP